MSGADRRKEKRLQYNWPVWFAEQYDGDNELFQGQMFDISSESATFTCYNDKCPAEGDFITARFCVPKYGSDDSFDMEHFVRRGKVFRVDRMSSFVLKVTLSFSEVLPFKPGETEESNALVMEADEELTVDEAKAFAEDVSTTIGDAKREGVTKDEVVMPDIFTEDTGSPQ